MREQLLGYLMHALDEQERELVEDELKRNPALQYELEILHDSLEPLRCDDEQFEPAADLLQRTCQLVANHPRPSQPDSEAARHASPPVKSLPAVRHENSPAASSRWSLVDFVVAAGIMIAGSLLLLPTLQNSRLDARLTACQHNLNKIGTALSEYSEKNHGMFPTIASSGKESFAGIYALKLLDQGYLEDPSVFSCPADSHEQPPLSALSLAELQKAREPQLSQIQQQIGGSYGYNLGFVNDRGYQSVRNLHRKTYPILSDAPQIGMPHSEHHGRAGQNVLFEDGHTEFLSGPFLNGAQDHIFLNNNGIVAAGVQENDVVLGRSNARPLIRQVSIEK